MVVRIGENKLAIKSEPKATDFNSLKNVENNFEHETDFIIKYNECLAERRM